MQLSRPTAGRQPVNIHNRYTRLLGLLDTIHLDRLDLYVHWLLTTAGRQPVNIHNRYTRLLGLLNTLDYTLKQTRVVCSLATHYSWQTTSEHTQQTHQTCRPSQHYTLKQTRVVCSLATHYSWQTTSEHTQQIHQTSRPSQHIRLYI